VIEAYGMTEAAHQMASNLAERRKPGTVGFAAGPSIAVMDEQGQSLPSGVTGEIVIRGENVMRGYDDAQSANEAAFLHGWFHTGDLGFFDADGYLVISGRIKEIINRGGEKVSPREVDEVLLEHPAVAEAVTFAIPDRRLGEAVGAAVVTRPIAVVSEIELREFAATRLAHFKVPEIVKIVPEIPKAATGKVQRLGLAEKLGIAEIDRNNDAHSRTEYSAPNSAIEGTLQKVWSEILGVSPIGIRDDFFALGGDSLAATILITRVAAETGVEPSFVRFLDNPTIAALATHISMQAAKPPSGLVPIQPGGTKPALFCIPGHDGLPVAFCNIARHLGPEQPLFSFPARFPAQRDASYSLEDLASEYIGLMKRHDPGGPYRIAGYCFGGFVAFEMARQLRTQGEQVSLLALIDTYNPSGGRPSFRQAMAQKMRHFQRRARIQRDALVGMSPLECLQYLSGRLRAFLRETRFRMGYAAFRILNRLHVRIPAGMLNVRYGSSLALSRYQPKPYPGSALLLRVQDLRPDVEQLGWGGVILGGLDMLDSPYHNRGAQTDAVARVMAEQLRSRLG
jgi:thioesterase domain-containing protein/acyl carrier protein